MGGYSIEKKAAEAAKKFFSVKKKYDSLQERFEERKKEFYGVMEEYFGKYGGAEASFYDDSKLQSRLSVRKVEKTTIEWDAEKLEKKVDKHIAKQIVKKQYRIVDMQGLTQYLKMCNVDPQVFKKFIAVDKSVDEKAIDRLGEVGEISVKQVSGCYTVKMQRPYYSIAEKNR